MQRTGESFVEVAQVPSGGRERSRPGGACLRRRGGGRWTFRAPCGPRPDRARAERGDEREPLVIRFGGEAVDSLDARGWEDPWPVAGPPAPAHGARRKAPGGSSWLP